MAVCKGSGPAEGSGQTLGIIGKACCLPIGTYCVQVQNGQCVISWFLFLVTSEREWGRYFSIQEILENRKPREGNILSLGECMLSFAYGQCTHIERN